MLKSKSCDRLAQRRIEFAEQREDVALQLGHLVHRQRLAVVETVERAEQIAEGVAQLAVLVGDALEDFVADPVILGVIDATAPTAG